MLKRVFILLAIITSLIDAQTEHTADYKKFERQGLSQQPLFTCADIMDYRNKFSSSGWDNYKDSSEAKRTGRQSLVKLSFSIEKPLNTAFKEAPIQLDVQKSFSRYNEQPAKLAKLALSQALFAGMGIVDYAIKEAPMQPGYRKDTFFWRTAWGGMVWGASIGANMMFVKDFKYLLGLLTEDMTYYVCRSIFHKRGFPENFGLPFRFMGLDDLPMKTVTIIWAASVVYLTLDAFDIL